ncbi:hypothetical protein GCM10010080_20440 [Thermomonas carbonis]|nr:hypothetical protein GCM10010080_20440 [Thermomonas carbonis]
MRLVDAGLVVEVSPRLGGRMLHLSLPGAPNLLKVGDAVATQPDPQVDAEARDIGYLGHQVWLGPQSQWWMHQQSNPARREAQAPWPPDPWLSYAATEVVGQTAEHIALRGTPSPVSGVRMVYRYALPAGTSGTLQTSATMRNIRDTPVSWDIWFNSRAPADTRVYVPVANEADVRLRHDVDGGFDGLSGATAGGFFSLDLDAPAAGKQGRRGKVFIQPRAGWMAGFRAGQAFVIRFELQPRERIHPEHGQVELYLNWLPDDQAGSLLEMEVHGPYTTLAPEAEASAKETWIVRRYDGPDRREAQLAFLATMLAEAGIEP